MSCHDKTISLTYLVYILLVDSFLSSNFEDYNLKLQNI